MIGEILGGLGGLASGISGLFGGSNKAAKKQNKLAKKALKWQKYYDANKISLTVADAKRAGIHPLAALGGSFSGSSVQSPGFAQMGQSDWGDSLGDVFGGLGQIAGSFQKSDRDMRGPSQSFGQRRTADLRQKLSENLDLQFKRASIEEVQSRTMLNNARMRELSAAPVLGPVGFDLPGDFLGVPPIRPGHAQAAADNFGDMIGEGAGFQHYIESADRQLQQWLRKRGLPGTPAELMNQFYGLFN